MNAAALAMHRPLAGYLDHACTAAAAEAVVIGPGPDLGGKTQHAEGLGVTLHHQLAQADPGRAWHVGGARQFEEEDFIVTEVADAMLGKDGQVLALQPVTGEQHTIAVRQESLAAVRQRPAARSSRIQKARTPARVGHLRPPPANPVPARCRPRDRAHQDGPQGAAPRRPQGSTRGWSGHRPGSPTSARRASARPPASASG